MKKERKYYIQEQHYAYEEGLLDMLKKCVKSCTKCLKCVYFNTIHYNCTSKYKCKQNRKILTSIMKVYLSLSHMYDDHTKGNN
jgi:hypothetical protein